MDKAGKIMNLTHMQQRIDTAANWTNDNPVLMEGEIGYEVQPETGGKLLPPKEKVGDGKTAWNDLPYRDGNSGGFKSYVTPTVTIDAGAEYVFTYPASERILTQVYEVSDGGTHDDKNVAFDSADKYTLSDSENSAVGDGTAQLKGGIDQYTKLLLHMNSDFSDSSVYKHQMTNNSAAIDNTNYKFGTGSGYFNGSTYLTTPFSPDFVFGNDSFTIDCWIKLNSINGVHRIIGIGSDSPYGNFGIGVGSFSSWGQGTQIDVYLKKPDAYYWDFCSGPLNLDTQSWHHVAISRLQNKLFIFYDGVLVNTVDFAYNLNPTDDIIIGARYQASKQIVEYFNGYIDELRVSKGIARWTSDFTPPNAEYHTSVVNTPCDISTTNASELSLSKATKINSLTIPVMALANTSVKILTSFDGRKTWLYHGNSGWHSFGTVGSEWTISNSNTELQNYFTNLSMAQLSSDLGYTPNSIDFMFQLETSDPAVTPVVSAITMNYSTVGGFGYADVGTYDDTCSRYGLKITSPTQFSIKNKDTASHTISVDIVPLTNITYLN